MIDQDVQRPSVGVGVIIIRDDTILLGKRKNAHGDGTWNFPGGHLEWNESIADCAHREVAEETGLEISNLIYGPYTNDLFLEENKHYLTAFVLANSKTGSPKVMEPNKCEKWAWCKWHELPNPLFLPIQNLQKIDFSPFRWSGSRIR
ncbi:MAG: NUDIX hydrolase [Patescibacteria group bacterium]